MNDFITPLIAKQGFEHVAAAAHDFTGFIAVIGDQAVGYFDAVVREHAHRIAAFKITGYRRNTRRQQTFVLPKRARGTGIDGQAAARIKAAGDPFFARGNGRTIRDEPCATA